MTNQYDDMFDLPHYELRTRPRMSAMDRAAQFSPFAALVGYDGAVKETARLTDSRIDLDSDAIEQLDEILRQLHDSLENQPEVSITYFKPDSRKEGGAYLTVTGTIKKIDSIEQVVVMQDRRIIPISEIIDITTEAEDDRDGGYKN